MSDWRHQWNELKPIDQNALLNRFAVTPFKVVLRPWYMKIHGAPVAFWKHYKLSREYMGRIDSVKWAFTWTTLLLFPKLFLSSKIANDTKKR